MSLGPLPYQLPVTTYGRRGYPNNDGQFLAKEFTLTTLGIPGLDDTIIWSVSDNNNDGVCDDGRNKGIPIIILMHSQCIGLHWIALQWKITFL